MKLTNHVYPYINCDQGEIELHAYAVNEFGATVQRMQRELVRTKDKAVYLGLQALGWTPPDGLHDVVFADSAEQADAARVAMEAPSLRAAIERAGPDALHAALAELGWTHLGRGVWTDPE